MNRRRLLASTASAAAVATVAGCLTASPGPLRSTSFGAPDERVEADGREKHLVFSQNGERQAVVTIQQPERVATPSDPVSIRFFIWHRAGLRTDRIRTKLRAPADPSVDVPAKVYLQTPDGGPWPPFTVRTVDNQWTELAVEGLGDLGRGSLEIGLILQPTPGKTLERFTMSFDVAFATAGLVPREYRATGTASFDVVVS